MSNDVPNDRQWLVATVLCAGEAILLDRTDLCRSQIHHHPLMDNVRDPFVYNFTYEKRLSPMPFWWNCQKKDYNCKDRRKCPTKPRTTEITLQPHNLAGGCGWAALQYVRCEWYGRFVLAQSIIQIKIYNLL